MIVRVTIFAVALACVSHHLLAQEASVPSPAAVSTPTGIVDQAAATRAWLDTVPADEKARSDAYFEGGYWLILWNFLLSVAISILFLGSRISAQLRDSSERLTKRRWLQPAIYAVPYIL